MRKLATIFAAVTLAALVTLPSIQPSQAKQDTEELEAGLLNLLNKRPAKAVSFIPALRQRFKSWSREQFDTALIRLSDRKEIKLIEANYLAPDKDKAEMLTVNKKTYHAVMLAKADKSQLNITPQDGFRVLFAKAAPTPAPRLRRPFAGLGVNISQECEDVQCDQYYNAFCPLGWRFDWMSVELDSPGFYTGEMGWYCQDNPTSCLKVCAVGCTNQFNPYTCQLLYFNCNTPIGTVSCPSCYFAGNPSGCQL